MLQTRLTLIIKSLTLGIVWSLSSAAWASEPFIGWHTENMQVLRGDSYKLAPRTEGTVFTFEHANRWRYGDFFGFVDYGQFDGADDTVYSELTPRFSLSKMTGQNFSAGPIQDVLITTQIELAKSGLRRYLKGIGADLAVPGFTFFRANLLHRNNPQRLNSTWQIYLAWKAQFQIRELPVVFEGFADFTGDEGGTTVPGQLIVPRLLVGVGGWLNEKPHKLQLGMEWQYWHNKFGIDGVTESVPQLQVKFTL